jgi:hypothetical protein
MNILKRIVHSHLINVLCSLIIGYSLWIMLMHNQIIQKRISVPVHIYESNNKIIQEAMLNILIEGARYQLRTLQNNPPVVNIYRDEKPGNSIDITSDDILLPESLSIMHYWPQTITLLP